jgi:hypothetical protein
VIRAARIVGKVYVLWFLQCSQSRRRRARRCETHRAGLRPDARRSRVIYLLTVRAVTVVQKSAMLSDSINCLFDKNTINIKLGYSEYLRFIIIS